MKETKWLLYTGLSVLLLGWLASPALSLVPGLSAQGEALGRGLTEMGLALLVGYLCSLWRYQKLSAEKRKDVDLQEQDERNVAIRGRAACAVWYVDVIALAVGCAVMSALDCTPGMILVVALFLLHGASFVLAARYFSKRIDRKSVV